jgi:hypothetical protein
MGAMLLSQDVALICPPDILKEFSLLNREKLIDAVIRQPQCEDTGVIEQSMRDFLSGIFE